MASLMKLHLELHKLMHPFEHVAHGGLIMLLLIIIKYSIEFFFLISLQIVNMTFLIAGFAAAIICSLFIERKYLKKLRKKL